MKKQVTLIYYGEKADFLLLNDDQIRLLKYLYDAKWLAENCDFKVGEVYELKEI